MPAQLAGDQEGSVRNPLNVQPRTDLTPQYDEAGGVYAPEGVPLKFESTSATPGQTSLLVSATPKLKVANWVFTKERRAQVEKMLEPYASRGLKWKISDTGVLDLKRQIDDKNFKHESINLSSLDPVLLRVIRSVAL